MVCRVYVKACGPRGVVLKFPCWTAKLDSNLLKVIFPLVTFHSQLDMMFHTTNSLKEISRMSGGRMVPSSILL